MSHKEKEKMAIPISIEKPLNENIVERTRIEFKEGCNLECHIKDNKCFANDMDNCGGDYVVIGIKEENGIEQ